MPPKRPAIVVEDLADANESWNMLIVGDSGVGKTVLAGQAPNAVFISTEKGTISAKRFGSTAKLIRVADWLELEAALDKVDKLLAQGRVPLDVMILDSAPKMQTMLLRHLLGIAVDDKDKKNDDIDLPQIQDHQKWQNMFLRFVDRIVEMPINVIFTAIPMKVEGESEDGEPEDVILPAIQGKAKEGYAIAQRFCAEMDAVYHLGINRKASKAAGHPVRRLLTEKYPPYVAKCRFGIFDTFIEEPDMAEIIAAISESGSPHQNGSGATSGQLSDADDEIWNDEDEEEPDERDVPDWPDDDDREDAWSADDELADREMFDAEDDTEFWEIDDLDEDVDEDEDYDEDEDDWEDD